MSPMWRSVGPLCLAGCIVASERAPTPLLAQSTFGLADVSVLSGCWAGRTGPAQVRENWTDAEGGAMLGTTRYFRDGVVDDWEFARIVADVDGVTLWPYPRGVRSPRGFPLVRADSALVFENLEHDFPVRIVYVREREDLDGTERLRVRIEGRDGDGREWTIERVPCPRTG